MLRDDELAGIEARAQATSGDRWLLARDADGTAIVRIEFGGGEAKVMRVMRDTAPASEDDVAFVAHARDDVDHMVRAARGEAQLSAEDLRAVAARSDAASPGPWTAFIARHGGVGGSNVIWVSEKDDQPDLYLWLGPKIAPDDDFEFIAHARQDIPRLLGELRKVP